MKKEFVNLGRSLISYERSFDSYLNFIYYVFSNKFIGSLNFRGKRMSSINFFYDLKYGLKMLEELDPNFILMILLLNINPLVYLSSMRIGTRGSQIPLNVYELKRIKISIKWILTSSVEQVGKISITNLIENIVSCLYRKGAIHKKYLQWHSMAISNRYLLKYLR